jgi:hypothetical protein
MTVYSLKAFAGMAIAVAASFTSHSAGAFGKQPERYVDAIDYPVGEGNWDRFYDLERRLFRDFDDVCGDTFCEGEYSNIQALRYRCSIERDTGLMGECIWVLAGSSQTIDPVTGRVIVDAPVWRCRTPLAPGTRADDFFRVLTASRRPIDEPLPGTQTSIYGGLSDCL